MTTPLRIDVPDRNAAIDLTRRLSDYRTRLVRVGVDGWYVAVYPGGNPDGVMTDVLESLQAWVAEHDTNCVLHYAGGVYPLRASSAF